MALRCFLFSSDEESSDVIRQVLTGLDVEGETCPNATTAVERVANDLFQLVIIDWDHQPEGGMVLSTARERKAAERPLTLAMVSDDASVPKALQAGANSILRKPLIVSQVTDTLKTARDLIRSRIESANRPPAAAVLPSVAPVASLPDSLEPGKEKTLRSGEFLQSGPVSPSRQFETESVLPEPSAADPIDALKDLETVAAAAPPAPPPLDDEPRGLEWYLKRKGIQSGAAAAPAPAPVSNGQPELLGFEQTPSYSAAPQVQAISRDLAPPSQASAPHYQQKEAALFSYVTGTGRESESHELDESDRPSPRRSRPGKTLFIAAAMLAGIAILAAPQAPWHPQMKALWASAHRSLHAWLNPQAVTTVAQAPAAHEDFGRPGDEYKLPVAENIPDASTDPSKIQVLPVVDPTAKKPTTDGTTADQSQAPTDAAPATPSTTDGSQPAVQVQQNPSEQPAPAVSTPAASTPAITAPATETAPPPAASPAHADAPVPVTSSAPTTTASATAAAPPRREPAALVPITTKVPSSLQSQTAVMVPDSSGNKPADAAMPAIEPVAVPELSERNLLADQPAIPYPATANGQQGTVILQVLIARDGTVQDAKFYQGSLAFARTAIDGVRQWKFKPYLMNGRPVSVATTLTINFKPAQ